MIAASFDVPADRVASFRARGSFRLVTLRDEADALLGFAAFSPSFPGAATFCARRPDLAVPLLEGDSLVAVLALYRERSGSFS